jgi:hypothetical protein
LKNCFRDEAHDAHDEQNDELSVLASASSFLEALKHWWADGESCRASDKVG